MNQCIDLGCGTGHDAVHFSSCNNIVGYDLDQENIAIAKKNFPQHKWHVADLTTLSLKHIKKPVHVRCTEVLEHIGNWKKAIGSIADLPRGSTLYLTVPHPAAEAKLKEVHPNYWMEIHHVHALSRDDIERQLNMLGWTVTSYRRSNAALFYELSALFLKKAPCVRGTYYQNILPLWQKMFYALLRPSCLQSRLRYLPLWIITIPVAHYFLDPFHGATQVFTAKKR